MLKSLIAKLSCPACKRSRPEMVAHVFDEGSSGHIRNGIVQCTDCRVWYPIEDDLLEMVQWPLLNAAEFRQFRQRFARQLKNLGLDRDPILPASNGDIAAQLRQREHFDWYANNREQSYLDYAQSPFWRAIDDVTLTSWVKSAHCGRWVLDVGCANGRASFSWIAHPQTTLIGCDISKKLVRQAIERARAAGEHSVSTFLVADGNNLPFEAGSFDYAMTYGVLHHLPNPGESLRQIINIIRPGGCFFGSENNQSVFRPLFDYSMQLKPLWTEEAGAEPLISLRMLRDWTKKLPVSLHVRTRVFLPPHLFNLAGSRLAKRLLDVSDLLAGCVPGLSQNGGLIIFEIHKDDEPIVPHHSANPALKFAKAA